MNILGSHRGSCVAVACGLAVSMPAFAQIVPAHTCANYPGNSFSIVSNFHGAWAVQLSPCGIRTENGEPVEAASCLAYAQAVCNDRNDRLLDCFGDDNGHCCSELDKNFINFDFDSNGDASVNLSSLPVATGTQSTNFYGGTNGTCNDTPPVPVSRISPPFESGSSFSISHGRTGSLISGSYDGTARTLLLSGGNAGSCTVVNDAIIEEYSKEGHSGGGVALAAIHKFDCGENQIPSVSAAGFSFDSMVTMSGSLPVGDSAEYFVIIFQAVDGSDAPVGSPISSFGWYALPADTDPTETLPKGVFDSEDFSIDVTGDPSSGNGTVEFSWTGGDLIGSTNLPSGAVGVRVIATHQSLQRQPGNLDLLDVDPSDGGSGAAFVVRINWDDRMAFNVALGSVAGDEYYNLRADLDLDGDVDSLDQGILNASCATMDFNKDGFTDFFDYLDFADAFAGTSYPLADVNGDKVVDFFDYLDWVDITGSCI